MTNYRSNNRKATPKVAVSPNALNPNAMSKRLTPVTQPLPGKVQIQNHDGGFGFKVTPLKGLERFLVLGVTGATYYVSKQQAIKEGLTLVNDALRMAPIDAINMACEISDSGRAANNEQAVYTLARAASLKDRPAAAAYALNNMNRVIRIGTHLHHFMQYLKDFGALSGCHGKLVQQAVTSWLNDKTPQELAFQANKYQTRDGWAWGDTLRLVHPKPLNVEYEYVFGRMLGKRHEQCITHSEAYETYRAFDTLRQATSADYAAAAIELYRLPLEACPTEFKKDIAVWKAVLPHLGYEALLRNLCNMGEYGVLKQGQWEVIELICKRLEDEQALHKARVHPAKVYGALKMYEAGRRQKNQGRGDWVCWDVVSAVTASLESAFYKSFANVEPTGKVMDLGLDVSASMTGGEVAGMPNTKPNEVTALMAMVQLKTENRCYVHGFGGHIVDLSSRVTRNRSLRDVARDVAGMNFGSTDPSLLITNALREGRHVDVFQTYTDNEVNSGMHPSEALRQYRTQINPNAKLMVCATSVTNFSIADPSDLGQMDVVGFDTAIPQLIRNFALM